MRVFAFVLAGALTFAAGCGGSGAETDHQAEWREVLALKRAATRSGATIEARQRWADAVRLFAERHPDHERAREVWIELQLDFADELMAVGRFQHASRFYRHILSLDPGNRHALRGAKAVAEALELPSRRLAEVERGMKERQVASLLGRPSRGWTKELRRAGKEFEAWYYRTPRGLVAVHFRDGRVIAVDSTPTVATGTKTGGS